METNEEKLTFKEWVKANKENLIALGIFGTAFGGIVWLSTAIAIAEKRAYDQQLEAYNERVDSLNRWVEEEQEAGNAIYPLQDGSFLVVPNAESKIVRK